jgi:ABC-type methionine transport system ATPase subunit
MLRMKGVVARSRPGVDPVLAGADLEVDLGEVTVVYGESGTGKSTLLRRFAGLEHPETGEVSIAGHDLVRLRPSSLRRMRQRVAFVEEAPLFMENRSAFANVALALEIAALPAAEIRQRTAEALAAAHLSDSIDTPPSRMSRSARRRLAFARAVALEPIALLADEPGRDLDEIGRDHICTLIEELASAGTCCLITSGDQGMLELAELWSWPVSELRGGQIAPFHEVTAAAAAERGQLLPFPAAARAEGTR